jgi:hypothetical protein
LETFKEHSDKIFQDINNWFKVNQLALNYNKTQYLQFNIKNSMDYALKLNVKGNYVKSSSQTTFLGLIIDDSPIVEGSYRPHYVQRNFKNGLFCIHTFNYKFWNNFGGKPITH